MDLNKFASMFGPKCRHCKTQGAKILNLPGFTQAVYCSLACAAKAALETARTFVWCNKHAEWHCDDESKLMCEIERESTAA